jgi:hypothetical protein
MFELIKKQLLTVTMDSKFGKFFADKSFKYDVLLFMARYIKNSQVDGFFNYNSSKKDIKNYTVDCYNLDKNASGTINFMSEVLNLFEFSKIIRNNDFGVYEILNVEILDFIAKSFENAYIFQYMLAYFTFSNDGLISDYELYVNENNLVLKQKILLEIYFKMCKLSPSIQASGTIWSKLYTKYPIIILGFANKDNFVSRELKISKRIINSFTLSANVNGTKTKAQYSKINNYSNKFDVDYVREFLKIILLKVGV